MRSISQSALLRTFTTRRYSTVHIRPKLVPKPRLQSIHPTRYTSNQRRHYSSSANIIANMATPRTVHLTPSDSPAYVYSSGLRDDTAKTASEILQEDLERHHVFFNQMHFHSNTLLFLLFLLFVYRPKRGVVLIRCRPHRPPHPQHLRPRRLTRGPEGVVCAEQELPTTCSADAG